MLCEMASKSILWLSILLSLQNFIATLDDNILNDIYSNFENDETYEALNRCEAIEGSVSGCSECYTCDDELLLQLRQSYTIRELKLNDAKCESSVTVCCVDQKELRFREKEDKISCGQRNPDGYPRRLRSELRSVLQGEYSWRVWIHKINEPSKSLCAGTYFNKESKLILTTASCVDGIPPSVLQVRFDKNLTRSPEAIRVLQVEVHEDFDTDTRFNDIAVLSLESVPSWAERACQPLRPALHGTNCIAVSSDDFYIDLVLPRQANCLNEKGVAMDQSLMCVASRQDAYTPEPGGGIFCIDESTEQETFSVCGIYLHKTHDEKAAVGTNVTHYVDWISERIKTLRVF